MILIIGLGNPGKKFENTRHNVGFMAIDEFAKKNNFPNFELQKKSNALVSEKENMLLAKPQTFMNESGKAVKELTKNSPLESLAVIHDDIDLPVGKIKIVKERGSAGHKGVESIIQNIGNDGLVRVRIGIRPASAQGSGVANKVVLKKFSKDEQKIIESLIPRVLDALDLLAKGELDKAMGEYNSFH